MPYRTLPASRRKPRCWNRASSHELTEKEPCDPHLLRNLLYNEGVQELLHGHTLNPLELAQLYHVLDDEYKRARIGKAARASFRLLEGVSYLLPLVLALAFLGDGLSDSFGDQLDPDTHVLVDNKTADLKALVGPTLAALVALLVANLPLLRKAYRQWLLSRRLIALRLLDYALLPPPRFRRLARLKLLVLLAPFGLLVLFLSSLLGQSAEPPTWRQARALSLLVLLPVVLFLADGLLRRVRVRIQHFEEVRALRNGIEPAANAGGESTLPPELLTRIADVERLRALRGSAEAMGHRPAEEDRGYAVRRSDSSSDVLGGLSASERVKLERAFEELASRQETSAETAQKGPSTLHVEGTQWQLVYEVEEATRTLHVISIRSQRGHGL